MNQKKARQLRKIAQYRAGQDEIRDRKYRHLVCVKVLPRKITHEPPLFRKRRTGTMMVNKGPRLVYRQMKKLYKEGAYERN